MASENVPCPSLPFEPPDSVRNWLRREDCEALTRAWEEAEAKAIAWAEGLDDAEEDGLFEEGNTPSCASLPQLIRRPRPLWDDAFHLLGQDHRYPRPLRRYFDKDVPAEVPLPNPFVGRMAKQLQEEEKSELVLASPTASSTSGSKARREKWDSCHHHVASTDNDHLHPHLRHYFDRRGIEASYRTRPNMNRTTPVLRPRTPQRPGTREKILKFRPSASDPSLPTSNHAHANSDAGGSHDPLDMKNRGRGNIHWGTRCLLHGCEYSAGSPTRISSDIGNTKKHHEVDKHRGLSGQRRIPWVQDHHVCVSDDNSVLNPMLRHYFEIDGLESSFRNRGLHYGRPIRTPKCLAPMSNACSRRTTSSISSCFSSSYSVGGESVASLDEA